MSLPGSSFARDCFRARCLAVVSAGSRLGTSVPRATLVQLDTRPVGEADKFPEAAVSARWVRPHSLGAAQMPGPWPRCSSRCVPSSHCQPPLRNLDHSSTCSRDVRSAAASCKRSQEHAFTTRTRSSHARAGGGENLPLMRSSCTVSRLVQYPTEWLSQASHGLATPLSLLDRSHTFRGRCAFEHPQCC